MQLIAQAVLFGLAGILFLAAGILFYRSIRRKSHRTERIILSAALVGLAILSGLRAYQQTRASLYTAFDWISGVLALAAASAACFSAYSIGIHDTSEEHSDEATRDELERLARYRLAFEKEPNLLVIKDRRGSYITANPAYARLLGKKDAELTGESDLSYLPQAQAEAFRQLEQEVIESGVARTRDEVFQGVDGDQWFRVTRLPLMDENNVVQGVLVSGQDITTQKRSEAALVAWKDSLGMLYDAEVVLGDLSDLSSAWESLLSWAGKLGGTAHGGLWQVDLDQLTAYLRAGTGKLEHPSGVQIRARQDLPWRVWQRGHTLTVSDYQNWSDCSQWGRESRFASAIGIPLKIQGRPTWILTLYYAQPVQAFREEQVQALNLLAQIASSSLQNSERLAAFKSQIGESQVMLGKLHYRARLEHVMSVIASHFIALDPEKVDEGIQHSLETLARFTGIDRCYLVLFGREGNPDIKVWYSNEPGAPESGGDDLSWKVFNWSLGKLDQFETIHIPRLTGMASEDEGIATYLQSRGIKSFTAIPMISNRSAIGYLGFEAIKAELEWPHDILALLKVCAEMFANLLERKWAEKATKENQERIFGQITALEGRNQESATITEMGELLQSSRTSDEAYPIIVRFIQRLLPASSGALYILHDSKEVAESVIAWGNDQPGPAEHELVLNECWGMRRGHIYAVQDPASESLCGHLKPPISGGYLCIPLIAQAGASGVLHIRQTASKAQGKPFTENHQRLAVKIAEYITMALANLKLRDELRNQAIRDPLTGLFNRRYMEETLTREIHRATRHATSVGLIMFDIDRMKSINDQFGHDAGDLLLRTLGRALHKMFRGEDVACRYGGDEFTIVLPEATLAEVWRRAEQVREMVKRMNFQYEGKPLTPLTLSIGVSAYPDHGQTAEKLLLACDAASYAAKSEGGDRIMMGREIET